MILLKDHKSKNEGWGKIIKEICIIWGQRHWSDEFKCIYQLFIWTSKHYSMYVYQLVL